MGSLIAQGALIGWPLVTLVLFLTMSTQRAIIASLLAGYLLLPALIGFDFPGVPTLDKTSIPNIATFLLALGMGRGEAFRWPKSLPVNLLMLAYVLVPFLTGFTNQDSITLGALVLPGMTLYASLSMAAGKAIELMPFIVAAGLLRTERAHRDMLLFIVMGAILYVPPILLEVVKGPFLQAKIYWIDPGSFYVQQVRAGGFRAMVFLGHGLLVGIFLALAVVAAIGLWRSKLKIWGFSGLMCAGGLYAVLIVNQSAGALLLSLVFGLLLMFLPPRRFVGVALVFAMIVVTYPVLRSSQLVPIDSVMSAATNYSAQRADSMAFRLRNEDMLLKRATQRPLFGWGAYGRNRIFVVTQGSGTQDISVTDGTWIITLGMAGWIGYLSLFGLLCYPFWHVFGLRRQGISPATAAVAALLLCNLFDLIPNSSLRPLTWLLAGALAGFSQIRRTQRSSHLAPVSPEPHPAKV